VAEPLRTVDGWERHGDVVTGRSARARRAVRGWSRAVLGWAARPARLLPGLAAVGCAVAGTWLLWSLGWALLVAAAFLLLLDARTPRG
jgi:hypothetical protein